MTEEKPLDISTECKKYYQQLYTKCGDILTESFQSDGNGSYNISHHFMLDLEKWIEALSSRPEVELLEMALREYQFALLALVQGLYRQAFMALRLFLELALSAVHFSSNELDFRVWQRNQRDINWSTLIDLEKGVLSKYFVSAFYEELTDEAPHCQAIAQKVYRECSEYVHGNACTNDILPDKLEFMKDVFFDWQEKARSVCFVVSFALCARYLKYLDKDARAQLESVIVDELGHITVIRNSFGGVTEVV